MAGRLFQIEVKSIGEKYSNPRIFHIGGHDKIDSPDVAWINVLIWGVIYLISER